MQFDSGFWAFQNISYFCRHGADSTAQFTEPSMLYPTTIHKEKQ
jgi:hypothetical protein